MRVPHCSRTFTCSPGYTHGDFYRAAILSSGESLTARKISRECAVHFRQILSKFPPQVSSRSTAAAWACHVHNEVNKSLRKDLFDCSKIGDFYDCGCAADDESGRSEGGIGTASSSHNPKPEMDDSKKTKLIQNGRELEDDDLKPLKLEKEG